MPIIAEKKSGDFKQVEPGTYVARCYSMIEIGTVETEYNGEKKKAHKVNITWELPTELDVFDTEKGQEPFVISKTYTLSMHEKSTLRKDLESWRGKGYTDEEAKAVDITKLLGQPCILSLIHQPGKADPTRNYVVISGISKLMKGQDCPEQLNPMRVLSYDNFDWNVFDKLSDYMKDKIKSSDEFKQLSEPTVTRDETNSEDPLNDLPF
ncbi:MAG: hypothetical protein WC139_13235 [Candidatus Kapaibacterium sp.]